MIGIIMAGGKGSRMNISDEKLLLKYKKPVILHVFDALYKSNCFSNIFAVTSPNSPKTKNLLVENSINTLESSGQGYVQDLNFALRHFDEPIFVTSGDLPLLDAYIIKKIVSLYDTTTDWMTILVTKSFLDSLGVSSDFFVDYNNQQCNYTGISIVNPEKISAYNKITERFHVLDDKRIAINLNTKDDYKLLGTA